MGAYAVRITIPITRDQADRLKKLGYEIGQRSLLAAGGALTANSVARAALAIGIKQLEDNYGQPQVFLTGAD